MVALDNPALEFPGQFGVARDRLYFTVSQYESDIWVAKLRF